MRESFIYELQSNFQYFDDNPYKINDLKISPAHICMICVTILCNYFENFGQELEKKAKNKKTNRN